MSEIKVIKKNDQSTTRWSGGTTTQLYIYPEDSLYKEQNFIFRLSSAVVEDETSTFTSLPDYKRILMILDGKLKLCHNDSENYELDTFNQNYFDGAFKTTSIGRVTDFNLMMRKNMCDGDVRAYEISPDSQINIAVLNKLSTNKNIIRAMYCYNNGAKIIINDKFFDLEKNDMILINSDYNNQNINIRIENKDNSTLYIIFSEIRCN